MALKPCNECRKEISTEATVCPNCGKKNPTQTSAGGRTVLIAIGVMLVIAFIAQLGSSGGSARSSASSSSTAPLAAPAPTPAPTRAERVRNIIALATGDKTVEGERCTRATQTRVGRVLDQHPAWPDEILATVACGWIRQGMTATQLTASWGKPEEVNRSVGNFGVHEQWVYGRSYAYVDDGVVTSWQSSR